MYTVVSQTQSSDSTLDRLTVPLHCNGRHKNGRHKNGRHKTHNFSLRKLKARADLLGPLRVAEYQLVLTRARTCVTCVTSRAMHLGRRATVPRILNSLSLSRGNRFVVLSLSLSLSLCGQNKFYGVGILHGLK